MLKTEKDEDFREMAKAELDELETRKEELEEELKVMLIPKDPDDHKDVIMEIRAGAGGDEAAIFAGDLYHRTYYHHQLQYTLLYARVRISIIRAWLQARGHA